VARTGLTGIYGLLATGIKVTIVLLVYARNLNNISLSSFLSFFGRMCNESSVTDSF